MTEKRILFGKFSFPIVSGLEYLLDEEKPVTDYLFVNEPRDGFSMYFENDFPIFTVPENSKHPYCLFEKKCPGRVIKFFCPERQGNLDSVVWYFYMELFDAQGVPHGLPGQVRVGAGKTCIGMMKGTPGFIGVLEGVELNLPKATPEEGVGEHA